MVKASMTLGYHETPDIHALNTRYRVDMWEASILLLVLQRYSIPTFSSQGLPSYKTFACIPQILKLSVIVPFIHSWSSHLLLVGFIHKRFLIFVCKLKRSSKHLHLLPRLFLAEEQLVILLREQGSRCRR